MAFISRSGSTDHNDPVRPLAPALPSLPSQPTVGIARRTAVLLLMAAAIGQAAAASGRSDHDRARAAVQAGEVMPLPALLERLQRSHPGQVLELELEREDGRWVYEVKLLQADGQLLKLELDARTAEVLTLRRRPARDSLKDGPKDGAR